jgi:ribulose-5-phosphate 4-epimerase/fuculose-1-phosphate aldolase
MQKFPAKMEAAGLCPPGTPLLGLREAEVRFNRPDPEAELLAEVARRCQARAIMFAPLAEPYRTIVDFLAGGGQTIHPSDCETRIFLHDLPLAANWSVEAIAAALKDRKAVIAPGRGVISLGADGAKQAFVFFSSVLFASFVKFFTDHLAHLRQGALAPGEQEAFERAAAHLDPLRTDLPSLHKGPFHTPEQALAAIDQAGKATVSYRLVDSFFGNVSYLLNGVLHISRTGSFLDELPGDTVDCPLEGDSPADRLASSELPAHRAVVKCTGHQAVLHGHPKFSVILSMDCPEQDCPHQGSCHLDCPRQREVCGAPIVPGEVGGGPQGLCNTVPPAMVGRPGVIVYGHGLFTTSQDDFNQAFANLLAIENDCREEYFRRAAELG